MAVPMQTNRAVVSANQGLFVGKSRGVATPRAPRAAQVPTPRLPGPRMPTATMQPPAQQAAVQALVQNLLNQMRQRMAYQNPNLPQMNQQAYMGAAQNLAPQVLRPPGAPGFGPPQNPGLGAFGGMPGPMGGPPMGGGMAGMMPPPMMGGPPMMPPGFTPRPYLPGQ